MSLEDYYVPTEHAERLTLEQLAEKFAAAELSCKIEPEGENTYWITFDPLESDILASVEDGIFVFGTFHPNGDDPVSVGVTVEQIMQSIGFSADWTSPSDE